MTAMTAPRAAAGAAAVLAIAVLYAGVHWGSTVAGGADSYGYVSEAGLWRQRHLTIQEDIIRASPWPLAIDTWAPLGYRAAVDRRDAIVPLYSPGLPILMALAQSIVGFCGAFFVVPLSGALTMWVTYHLGQRVFGDPATSLAATILTATSPVFLYQLMNPMTDVPVTAAWALALVLTVSERPFAAGLAAGVAMLIRPNTVPLALPLLAWSAATGERAAATAFSRVARMAVGLAPAAIAVAAINASLYGGPLLSGYGTLGDLYSRGHVTTNVRQFVAWIAETQTPVVALAALYFAAPSWFPAARIRYPRALLGATLAISAALYLFYQPFDAWWYLRFLLPMWPVLMLLTSAALVALARRLVPRAAVGVVLMSVGLLAAYGVRSAIARQAFDIGRAERRTIDLARFVSSHTDADAVMISLQHSGTLRLYAGRLTLRYDQLDPVWLDRAVAFLQANGRHPYVVLEGSEVEPFRQRFGSSNRVGRLDWRPFATLTSPYIAVYDAIDSPATSEPLAIGAAASKRSGWRCDLPQIWPPVLRMK
ncbi:MAG: glycosyltransferase family 39 protein [Vicinamibacterales bacterium]